MTGSTRNRPIGRIALHVMLLIMVVLTATPFLWMLSTSLKRGPDVFTPVPSLVPIDHTTGRIYATLENYEYVFTQKNFGMAFVNSLFVVGIVVPLKLMLDALAAYAFARIPFPGRDKLFLGLLSSMMVPGVALLVPRVYVTKALGLYDSLWGLIIPMSMSVFDVFLLRQFFLTLPYELEEAAMLDGAGRLRIFTQVILPLSRPALSVVVISSFIWHWNDLTWPLVITNTPSRYTLPLALALLTGGQAHKPQVTMAGATIAVLPVIIIFLAFQKRILEGIVLTGIKG
jgi:multiple sugar transport system permease protein